MTLLRFGKTFFRLRPCIGTLSRSGKLVARASRLRCGLTGGTPVPLPFGSWKAIRERAAQCAALQKDGPVPNTAGGDAGGTSQSKLALARSPGGQDACPKLAHGQSGFLLEECLVYLVISSLLLGLAFAAFYRVMDNARSLRRNAADIARALKAGERWRDDVHRAAGPVRLVVSEDGGTVQAFHVPQRTGEVVYFFTETNVLRRADPDAPWVEALGAVKHSRLVRDLREGVAAWRWEMELDPGRKEPLVRPLFTFQAAAPAAETP